MLKLDISVKSAKEIDKICGEIHNAALAGRKCGLKNYGIINSSGRAFSESLYI